MKRFCQSILINTGLVLALVVGAASMSSAAHAGKMVAEPTSYAMHIDEIGPAAAIGQSTAALKLKLQANKSAVIGLNDQ